MFTEGKGLRSPKPERVVLCEFERSLVNAIANVFAAKHHYVRSSNAWTKGLTEDPFYVGLCGEYAFQKYVNGKDSILSMHSYYLTGRGDLGFDFRFGKHTIDVKTSTTGHDLLVRRVSDKSHIVRCADYIVKCFWDEKTGTATLNGYVCTRNIEGSFKRSPYGHFNLVFSPCQLEPIATLRKMIRQWHKSDTQEASIGSGTA